MRRSRNRLLAIGYTVALTYLLLVPHPLFFLGETGASADEAVSETVADWVQHAAAFSVLTGVWIAAFGDRWGLGAIGGIALVYGALTECLQGFIPQREFGWSDLIANAAGVAGATLVAGVVSWWKSN